MELDSRRTIRKYGFKVLSQHRHIFILLLCSLRSARGENSTLATQQTQPKREISNDVAYSSNYNLTMNKAEIGVTITILFLLMLVSLTGNILVILSYLISKRLRGYAHLLILNLAISDLCITCLSLPLRICQLFGLEWSDGFTSCSVNVAFTIFFFTASNINLFLVTLDRYLGVIHAVKYRAKGSRKKVKHVIVLSWFVSFSIGFLPLTGLGQRKHSVNDGEFICTFGTVLRVGYVGFVTICTLLVPWVLMIGMYTCVLRVGLSSVQTGMRSKERLQQDRQPVPEKLKKREIRKVRKRANELKLAKAVFLVLTLYTICMVPIGVIDLIQIWSGFQFPEMVIKIALMLAYFNPAVNPPIYAASIEHYRKAFIKLLVCRRWYEDVRARLQGTRASSYKSSCVGDKSLPMDDKAQPWRNNLTVPGHNGRYGNSSIMQSNNSEYEGSQDELSYDDTTAVGTGLSTLAKSNVKSLKSALYTSATTLLSIIFSEEVMDQCLLDSPASRRQSPLGESAL